MGGYHEDGHAFIRSSSSLVHPQSDHVEGARTKRSGCLGGSHEGRSLPQQLLYDGSQLCCRQFGGQLLHTGLRLCLLALLAMELLLHRLL